jgi:hypothetical protein
MSTTYTPNAQLGQPASGDRNWNTPLNANCTQLDGLTTVGHLCVTTTEVPSASLNVKIAAGAFIKQDGTIGTYAGISSTSLSATATTVLYLDGTASFALATGSSYPATPHVRLATVATGSSAITSIADNRKCYTVAGTVAEGVNWTFGTVTGTKIGTATNQKIGFYGATPIVQPSGAAQAAMTNSTGGTVGTTLSTCGATNSADQSGVINTNFASLNNLVEALRTALVNLGAIKGSA